MAISVQSYLNNAKWVKRADECLQQFDRNKSGFISREDWLMPIEDLKKILPDRVEMLDKAQAATEEYLDVLGLTKGMKADKQKFRELMAAFAISEAERSETGEQTYAEKITYALFDAIDKNSKGYLSFDEYKVIMAANNVDENTAQAAFDVLDMDKSGKLYKSIYAAAAVKFWCILDEDD